MRSANAGASPVRLEERRRCGPCLRECRGYSQGRRIAYELRMAAPAVPRSARRGRATDSPEECPGGNRSDDHQG